MIEGKCPACGKHLRWNDRPNEFGVGMCGQDPKTNSSFAKQGCGHIFEVTEQNVFRHLTARGFRVVKKHEHDFKPMLAEVRSHYWG